MTEKLQSDMFNLMDKTARRNFYQIYDIHTDVTSDRKNVMGHVYRTYRCDMFETLQSKLW